MKGADKEEFGAELADVAGLLRRADLSADSLVREELRDRLLQKAEKPARGWRMAWLLPAAAVMAAGLIVFNLRRGPEPRSAGEASAYNLSYDAYGDCGRRGLPDYQAAGRY